MSVIVSRTCAEILPDNRSREPAPESLEAFRSAPAYVLLGDPGSGKSTAFCEEAKALGSQAKPISARDFLTLDVDSHPEWRDRTLFIDGLDEIRAGSGDRREALDRVRRRLDRLGRPRFRISCREADWLGNSDRNALISVSPDSSVKTLMLNPLTEDDIARILDAHPDVDDARWFIGEARKQGVEGLLNNPLTLDMLARAVGGNENWPRSRSETFDMACRQMAKEQNYEHVAADRPPPVEQLLGAAGRLCAYQLITGVVGCSLNYGEADADYIDPDCLEGEVAKLARRSLGTRLFTSVGDGRFIPAHRHIAEFLGARYLARLIGEGLPVDRLPVGRALALITGGDGMVVTVLRGLSAWLAAQCPAARDRLIDSDPVGVGLYGDLRGFSADSKRRLLRSLNREVADYGMNVSAFAPLATPDMVGVLEDFLTDERRDTDHQLVTDFLLRVLRHGAPLASLSPVLFEMVYDDSRWPRVVKSALDAFIHTSAGGSEDTARLRKLLIDIERGRVADRDNELLGIILAHLYPREIPASEIWKHLNTRGNPDIIGAFFAFWETRLMEQSSDGDVAELLDCLNQLMPALRPRFRAYYLDRLPVRLLVRALHELGDEQEPDRLYGWLNAAAYPTWDPPRIPEESTGEIRAWLEQRPAVQKAVLLEGLTSCPDDDAFERCAGEVWDRLHHSAVPSDFGLWCLDTAVALADTNPRVADCLLRNAVHHCGQQAGGLGLTREVLLERTSGYEALERRLAELLRPPRYTAIVARPRSGSGQQTEADRNRERLVERVRANADALRENRADPGLLFSLARAYFGDFLLPEIDMASEQGLAEILGNDDLVEAARAGLRGTVARSGVPGVAEIIQLSTNLQVHPLGLPFLAGVEEIDRVEPERLERLSRPQMQQALAFHYSTPASRGYDPAWYVKWLDTRPELVADVLVQCATPAIRRGSGHIPELYDLVHRESHRRVAAHASLRLLELFPLRNRLSQIETLDRLLWAALQYADRTTLQGIIEKKLSRTSLNVAQRIHWLAAGVVIAPETYLRPLENLVSGQDGRARKMAVFFAPDESLPFLVGDLDAHALQTLIRLMGRVCEPTRSSGWVTAEMRAAEQVEGLAYRLSSLPGDDATRALEELSSDAWLAKWRDFMERARDWQRVIHRDASYQHPDIEQVRRTLSNGAPANSADLDALVAERLEQLAERVSASNTDDWRQYWNEDPHGRPVAPKHEEHCRDALLSDLRGLLPDGVDAQREGQYRHDKRADIRIACGAFNVPVEIKRDGHRELWSAMRNQLIEQYVSDPATGGHGIYLVFWFGDNRVQPPPQGRRPNSPVELRERLEATLTEAETRKIAVLVVDVSKGG